LAREQRRLAAILAADVVGYSRLMGRDESGTLARLRAHRKERFEPTLARHGGRLVKLTGDGALAEFPSAVDAMGAAIEFQQLMAEVNRSEPGDTAIVFRIGLHLGDLIVEGDDLYGDGVNVAARLEGEAPPGGILISGNVHDAVVGRLKATVEDLGILTLKNIERPVQAFRVGWNASDWTPQATAAVFSSGIAPPPYIEVPLPLPDRPSIAVLPFENMSGDPEQEYFADGMVEDIITALSKFKALFVIARNSTFTYKGRSVDIKQVGRELGVRYVLEGSVRRAGGRVRVTGQLIEAQTGTHIWADKFDGAMEDVFDLQDKVTVNVVGAIAPKLERAEIERARQKPTELLRAYDLYLRAMALASWRDARRETYEDACRLFTEVTRSDPEYAAAHVMAAFTRVQFQSYAGVPLDDGSRFEAIRHAEVAVKLGSEDAFVLARAGHVFAYLGHDLDRAIRLSDQAIALNPNLAPAWHSRGWVSIMNADPDRAIQSFDRLVRLSPLDPLRTQAWYGTAFAHMLLKQYTIGCEEAFKAIQVSADAHSLGAFIVNAVLAGRMSDAQEAAQRLLRIQPNFRTAYARSTFPIRSDEWQEKIAQSLVNAGIPL
jgi:TolB-like protein/class 3 adenylate cyclase/tetratricopeptide (TPR) repeat protein